MANDIIDLIVRVNLVIAAAIAAVLLLRYPARRLFGARVAYALWVLPLLAAAMCFVPSRVIHVVIDAPLESYSNAHGEDAGQALIWAWAGGVLASLVVLAMRQQRFLRALGHLRVRDDLGAHVHAAESARHGPAIIGVLRPVIVTPADFETRFDEQERRIVLAHERAHLAQGDPWINVAVLAVQCLNWFNPLVHLGARALRMDQELACDAVVLAQADGARRRYAEAMLKTHLAAAVPIGCAWPPSSVSALKERIAMLKRTLPTRKQAIVGVSIIAIAAAGACVAAWAVQPPHVVATVAPQDAAQQSSDFYTPVVADDELEGGEDMSGIDPRDEVDGMDEADGADELDALDDMDEPDLSDLEDFADEHDLTPAQRARVSAALREVHVHTAAIRETVQRAMHDAQLRQGQREIALDRAREAMREVMSETARAERETALAEAAREMAEVEQVEDDMPELREAVAEARAEVARAAAAARAQGDAIRAEQLERAERALREADVDGPARRTHAMPIK